MMSSAKSEPRRLWKLIGKFLKRLGPILPIASWAIYLVPSLASYNRIFYVYSIFIAVSAYLCFFQPRTLEQKVSAGLYDQSTEGYQWKRGGNVLDAIFMSMITYSLIGMLASIFCSVSTIPLASLVHLTSMPDHPTILCVAFSTFIGLFRYRQKTTAHRAKCLATQQPISNQLNQQFVRANETVNRWTRMLCDGIVIFYNCFFVGSSAIIVLCGAHMPLIIQQYVMTKMLLVSGLLTATVSLDNQKGSREYLTKKVEALANARWSEVEQKFAQQETHTGLIP